MEKSYRSNSITVTLMLLLLLAMILSACFGALDITLGEIGSAFRKIISGEEKTWGLSERIFITIRLPRVLLCCFVGSGLAVGGLLLQSIFRNPIIEPGLIGISSGAAFGASLYFVFGAAFKLVLGQWMLPLAATAGAVIATAMVMLLSLPGQTGKNTATGLLLTGIAINALFMSGVGFLSFFARDPQARSITFWGLGTLSGANWSNTLMVGGITTLCIWIASRYAGTLNVLSLEEAEAQLLGVPVGKTRIILLSVNVVMIAASTAFVGNISFVGLIVPHLVRLLNAGRGRVWVWNTALCGALLLSFADIVARLLLRPAELPIGIVTSVVGVPVFLVLLRKKSRFLHD